MRGGRHSRGLPLLPTSVLPPRWPPDVLGDHDSCAGVVLGKVPVLFPDPDFFFPNLQKRVSELRPSLELSQWLEPPLGYKGTVHTAGCIYTSHSLLLPASPFPLKVSFLFFFAKQPRERDKIILKSIIWWEF